MTFVTYEDTPLARDALREVLSICHREKFSWQDHDMLRVLGEPGGLLFFVPSPDQEPTAIRQWDGFVFADCGPFSCDLLYIFVRPELRGTGLGAKLFQELIRRVSLDPKMEKLFLEVRVSNSRAKRLYEKFGMRKIGTRPRYYNDGEDADIYEYLTGAKVAKYP